MSASPNSENSSVIAEGDLVVEIGEIQGGGDGGAAVIEDISLTLERDNTMHHGIGNDDPVDHTTGNRTYTISTEAQMSQATFTALQTLYENDTAASGVIFDSNDRMGANIGVIVWNSIEIQASDGDNVTASIDADCYQVDLPNNAET